MLSIICVHKIKQFSQIKVNPKAKVSIEKKLSSSTKLEQPMTIPPERTNYICTYYFLLATIWFF